MTKTIAVAPMMAWTDRHCRHLHRLYAPNLLLFTEMITTGALLHGKQLHLLDYDAAQHPLAIQLGGNNPEDLAACAKLAERAGYDEININVGCPSDRVQRGTFGACLMLQPDLVARCVEHMQNATSVPITVKCRIGVETRGDEGRHATYEFLHEFIRHIVGAGCKRVYLHARTAILAGLSPAQNRSVPPLRFEFGRQIKQDFPQLELIMNGGIDSLDEASSTMTWADGVMIGRAAYHQPRLLSELNGLLSSTPIDDEAKLLNRYRTYAETRLAAGDRLHDLVRHLLHSFAGQPGARRFRQTLSDHPRLRSEGIDLLDDALTYIEQRSAA